jgi:hypothetical protein
MFLKVVCFYYLVEELLFKFILISKFVFMKLSQIFNKTPVLNWGVMWLVQSTEIVNSNSA